MYRDRNDGEEIQPGVGEVGKSLSGRKTIFLRGRGQNRRESGKTSVLLRRF